MTSCRAKRPTLIPEEPAIDHIVADLKRLAATQHRFSVRISRAEYAKLASRVTENAAQAYKAGVEPLPYDVANTFDFGYAYDRFSDGSFCGMVFCGMVG